MACMALPARSAQCNAVLLSLPACARLPSATGPGQCAVGPGQAGGQGDSRGAPGWGLPHHAMVYSRITVAACRRSLFWGGCMEQAVLGRGHAAAQHPFAVHVNMSIALHLCCPWPTAGAADGRAAVRRDPGSADARAAQGWVPLAPTGLAHLHMSICLLATQPGCACMRILVPKLPATFWFPVLQAPSRPRTSATRCTAWSTSMWLPRCAALPGIRALRAWRAGPPSCPLYVACRAAMPHMFVLCQRPPCRVMH